jgi:hypothetical protein
MQTVFPQKYFTKALLHALPKQLYKMINFKTFAMTCELKICLKLWFYFSVMYLPKSYVGEAHKFLSTLLKLLGRHSDVNIFREMSFISFFESILWFEKNKIISENKMKKRKFQTAFKNY